MAKSYSYSITFSNNISENEGIQFVLNSNYNFLHPNKELRKLIMYKLWIEKRFYRSFDLILLPQDISIDDIIREWNFDTIKFIELKTTKKELKDNPYWFFFWATQNEFDLANKLWEQFLFCFVSLHINSKWFKLLSLKEVEDIIQNKRIQYQINLKRL